MKGGGSAQSRTYRLTCVWVKVGGSAQSLVLLRAPGARTTGAGPNLNGVFIIYCRAVDPDPPGSAFIFPPGSRSGFAFNMRNADPDPGGKICTKNARKLVIVIVISNFIQIFQVL